MAEIELMMVRKAAVLGAGVMGAQIAAHLVNAGVETVLFELAASDGDPNATVRKAIENLGKIEPAPLARKSLSGHIQAANYDEDLAQLEDCDLIIEAIAERMDWKRSLYERIAPHINSGATIGSNTSGLSISALWDKDT